MKGYNTATRPLPFELEFAWWLQFVGKTANLDSSDVVGIDLPNGKYPEIAMAEQVRSAASCWHAKRWQDVYDEMRESWAKNHKGPFAIKEWVVLGGTLTRILPAGGEETPEAGGETPADTVDYGGPPRDCNEACSQLYQFNGPVLLDAAKMWDEIRGGRFRAASGGDAAAVAQTWGTFPTPAQASSISKKTFLRPTAKVCPAPSPAASSQTPAPTPALTPASRTKTDTYTETETD